MSESWNFNGTPIHFFDNSIPKDNPVHFAQNDAELQAAIYQRIYASNVVIIPTGIYASYSKWIQKEIAGANTYSKPILAVRLWSSERKSSVVMQNSSIDVGWQKKSVIDGIWGLYARSPGVA